MMSLPLKWTTAIGYLFPLNILFYNFVFPYSIALSYMETEFTEHNKQQLRTKTTTTTTKMYIQKLNHH